MRWRLPRRILGGMRNLQVWSSTKKLRPSMCLHFSGKWIISTIVFIPDIVNQALAKITCFYGATTYYCKTTIDTIYRFRIQSPTEIWKMVAWLFPKYRFTCPTDICEISSKFPSCLIVVLTINYGVQVCITHTLTSTCWTKLWQNPTHACLPGWQRMVDGCRCQGNECRVHIVN